jgi:DNA-binding MarR family transcriptional regulator
MAKRTDQIEFESMLLSRHIHMSNRSAGGDEGGIERGAYILLSRLRVEGAMSIGQLAEAFELDVSTLNRRTAALSRAGLIERIPDPEGGIARKFRLTEAGQRELDETRTWNVAGLDRVMEGWSEEDAEVFAGYLRRFNTDIERVSGRPWPRP